MKFVALVMLLLALVGCGGNEMDEREPDAWYGITVTLADGRRVDCVTNDLEDAISCDWSNAR